ncbi:MAG: dependent oxidoreductase [Blastococcus sp.]|nr:dependent oxidoreductase [Blastococcus sp.]
MTESADVVVIGAGHNSLIGAAYLAAAGLEVLVLEEQSHVGGNTVTEELTLPGFRHDSCSSAHVLIQSNPVIRDDELGLLSTHGLRYVHTDPAVVLPLSDEDALVMSRDRAATAGELARWDAADGEAYLQLLADWEGGLAAAHGRWNAGALDPRSSATDAAYETLRTRTAQDVIAERFVSAQARDLLTWLAFATIIDPRTPGTGILPFSITAGRSSFGWATPMGGSGALPAALVASIEANGGRVLTGRPVERVQVRDGRAVAVVTADGDTWAARRAVLSSAHITQLAGMLEGIEPPEALRSAAETWRPGLTLFAVHLATDGDLAYETGKGPVAAVAGGIGSVGGLSAQLDAHARGETYAADPWVLIVNSTVVDPGRAPDGQGLVKLLTFAPRHLAGGGSWDLERDRFAAQIVERTAERVPGLRPEHVLAVRGEAPVDLEERNRHNVGGSCHGGEFRLPSGEVLVGWPSHELPVEGLFQTGATAHPGGSVSGRAGRNAARAVLTALGIDPATVMGPGA